MFKRVMFIVGIVVLSLTTTFAASAQEARTVTVNETEINESFRVTNPYRASVSNRAVDLQAVGENGQAVVSGTVTLRRTSQSYNAVATYAPLASTITDGIGGVDWELLSLTISGQPTERARAQINSILGEGWRNYIQEQIGRGNLIDLQISDAEIVYTFQAAR